MNAKKLLCILLVFMAVGTAMLIAQQSWAWNPEGNQCFSLANVEYYYDSSAGVTVLKNNNNYGVTVLYTKRNGDQQSAWLASAPSPESVKKIDGKVTVDQCKKN